MSVMAPNEEGLTTTRTHLSRAAPQSLHDMALEGLVALEVGIDEGRPDGCLTVGVDMPGQALHGECPLPLGQGEDHGDGRVRPHLALKARGDRDLNAAEGDVMEHSRV